MHRGDYSTWGTVHGGCTNGVQERGLCTGGTIYRGELSTGFATYELDVIVSPVGMHSAHHFVFCTKAVEHDS